MSSGYTNPKYTEAIKTGIPAGTTLKSTNQVGVYSGTITDRNGNQKQIIATNHTQIAQSNAKKVDGNIQTKKAELATYTEWQQKKESAQYQQTLAANNLQNAYNDKAMAQQTLNQKQSALSTARQNTQTAQQELAAAKKSGDATAISNAQKNLNNAKNTQSRAESQYKDAQQSNKNADENISSASKKAAQASKNVDNLNSQKPNTPNLTNDDLKNAQSQVRNTRSASSKNIVSQHVKTNTVKTDQKNGKSDSSGGLYDLRNINGKNFRGIGNAQNAVDKSFFTMSSSRSFFMGQDYRFAETLTATDDLISTPKVPPIILNQFQPYDMLSPADVINGVGDVALKLVNSIGGCVMKPVIKWAGYQINRTLVDKYSQNSKQLYGEGGTRQRKYFTSDPVQVVQNMFNGGRWLNTYQLPYFGGDYLKATYKDSWTLGDSKGFLGALAGGQDSLGTKMLGIDFPSNPKFKAQMDKGRDPINLQFYLINSDNTWLRRNFEFLNAIYAGANWLHLKYCFVRSPNIYHVLCPGRFQIYWAAIDVTVTFEGKLRKNTTVSQQLHIYSKAIDDDMLWPDAWKINISIRDLTPNNFNLYAQYYQNGFNANQVSSLAEVKGLSDISAQLGSYLKEFADDTDLKGLLQKGKATAAEAAKSAVNITKNLGFISQASADKANESINQALAKNQNIKKVEEEQAKKQQAEMEQQTKTEQG